MDCKYNHFIPIIPLELFSMNKILSIYITSIKQRKMRNVFCCKLK